jgi:cytochrome c553
MPKVMARFRVWPDSTRDYLARQLEAYASMERANEIMREISKDMTAEQISEVTAYLATL